MARLISGVVVVDKPQGPTSHDVVARARKKLGTREVGHAGTLDPMATGVLVLAAGEATKLVPYLTASDKTYEATIELGVETDTLDADGAVVSRADVPAALDLDRALDLERARTAQAPPAFSAIHASGERAHERARRGESVTLEPREVAVRAIEVVSEGPRRIELRLTVSKGYYVRALARDLARALGTVGHLVRLRRTRSGAFDLSDACALDAELVITPLESAARRVLPSVVLGEAAAASARSGRPIALSELGAAESGPHAWFDADGKLVAIGAVRDGAGRVLRGFR